MTCHVPPVTRALWEEISRAHPGRRTTSDGACPGGFHHSANPTSDHEPDPHLNDDSCAADLSHDPAKGVDAHELGDRFKHDPRVKYLIRPNFQTHVDEIWSNEKHDTHWRDAGQHPRNHHEQGGGHLHISFWHRRDVLDNTARWLAPYVPPEPEDDDMAQPIMVYPEHPLPDGSRPTVLTVHGDHRGVKLTREEADEQNKAGVQRIELPMVLWNQMVIR
jgi:hypothetical protein